MTKSDNTPLNNLEHTEINFEDFKQRFDIDCKQYFKKEIQDLHEMEKDGF